MKKQTALLVIDAQNDFHDKVAGATLAVPGATEDTQRLATFIERITPVAIFASLDSHNPMDIAHPGWWTDAKGATVNPFTMISADDAKNGKYVPVIDPVASIKYLEALEANGEFKHFIWPEHCLIGTTGQALHPIFSEALRDWSVKTKKWVAFINKGTNPYTEHFGIFRANVPTSDPSTQVNQGIFSALNSYDEIYLGGQARTHCVANSLKQLLEISPNLASKLVVLEDATSNVEGLHSDFYAGVDAMYADAASKGVRFAKTTDI